MDRIFNKTIVFLLSVMLMVFVGITTPAVFGMLLAVCLTSSFELPAQPGWLKRLNPVLFCVLTLFFPEFAIFLPLAAGDLFQLRPRWWSMIWLIPLLSLMVFNEAFREQTIIMLAITALCVVSCLLSWREERVSKEHAVQLQERDRLAQISYELEVRNRSLNEESELTLRLATLKERSRIAREIHDNVGHLLTRSILQVKALAVTHQEEEQLAHDLQQVGNTLDSAFDTVRQSVHALYEESNQLHTQLEVLAHIHQELEIQLEYRAEDLPSPVAYSFLAIAREALSNIERHSNATAAHISVVEFPGIYQLIIHDNGNEDPATLPGRSMRGMGLASMEERTRALGGIFRTSFDRGFKVVATVPKLDEENACES